MGSVGVRLCAAATFTSSTVGNLGQSKRLRCIIIVALARKLAIALWRYLETGLIPEGAVLKTK